MGPCNRTVMVGDLDIQDVSWGFPLGYWIFDAIIPTAPLAYIDTHRRECQGRQPDRDGGAKQGEELGCVHVYFYLIPLLPSHT